MGPLLFLIYINDLPKVSKKLTFFLFADDTNIYYESSDILENCQQGVKKSMEVARRKPNRLALNIEKTNFVLFHFPRNKPVSQIILKFGKKKINQENCVKFLGLLLDSNLNWKPHITKLSKKLSRTVGLFYKIRHYAPLETLKLLYYGIFFPFFCHMVFMFGVLLTVPILI